MYVYLHGMEVKGSPFSLRIGKDVREPRTGAKDLFRPDRKVSRYFIYTYIFLKAGFKDFFLNMDNFNAKWSGPEVACGVLKLFKRFMLDEMT